MDQDESWHAGRPRPWQHCVRWGLRGFGAQPPKFSAHVYCAQTAGWIKMPLGMEVGLNPSDIMLDGDPAPLPQKGHSPQFLAHVYCAQTAAWIKMKLGIEVGLDLATLC